MIPTALADAWIICGKPRASGDDPLNGTPVGADDG